MCYISKSLKKKKARHGGALRRLRQADCCAFKASPNYKAKPYLKSQTHIHIHTHACVPKTYKKLKLPNPKLDNALSIPNISKYAEHKNFHILLLRVQTDRTNWERTGQ